MNHSRKIIWFHSCTDIKAYMSSRSNISTHYETLNVKPSCTQAEIKSAYYELSKKFHPDKNVSANANKKFQDISNAYQVLGNFDSRRVYDRDLQARGHRATVSNVRSPVPEDPLARFYQSRRANVEQGGVNSKNDYFDYNKWSQSHYGSILERSIQDRQARKIREDMRKNYRNMCIETDKSLRFMSITATMCLIAVLITHFTKSEDRNRIKRYDEEK